MAMAMIRKAKRSKLARSKRFAGLVTCFVWMTAFPGCQSDAQMAALIGTGLGALAGQATGGDTEGTVIGAATGAGLGYVISNESGKAKQEQHRRYDPDD